MKDSELNNKWLKPNVLINKPKRPPTAFFCFMSEFRDKFRMENPYSKSVCAVGKAGGKKWKSMTNAEKAPYIAMAEKKKAKYEKSKRDREYNKCSSMSEINDEDEDNKVLSELGNKTLLTSDPIASVSDTVMANPQTNVSQSVDVVMKDQAIIPEEMVTLGGLFQKVDSHQDTKEDLLQQVKQECSGDPDDADPADDLLSLLTDSSPAASAFSGPSSTTAWLDSSDSDAMELFKELKRLVSKPLDVTTVDTSAFDQMRRLVEELKRLKQGLPLSSQSTLEQVNNFLPLHASKNAFLTATLPVYEQAVNSKEDLVKKLLPLKEQKDEIAVNRKQHEAVKVKAEEKVDQLKKQLALAEAELAEANTGIAVFINLEKERVSKINALRGEVNQTAETLRNLQSDYELAVWTKKELEDLWLKITQSSSP